jgi:prevent-host-death family protein
MGSGTPHVIAPHVIGREFDIGGFHLATCPPMPRMTDISSSPTIREVGIRELKRDGSRILSRVERDGERVVVTRHGRPVGVILAVEDAVDLFLLSSDQYVEMRLRAREELSGS